MTEFIRRMDLGIYDKAEYDRAFGMGQGQLPGRQGFQQRREPAEPRATRPRLGDQREMALDARDLMVGNSALDKAGHGEERSATTRFVPGSGPAAVDRLLSQRRLHGSDPQLVIRLEMAAWTPYVLATENDALNGHDHARPLADEHVADVRRLANLLAKWTPSSRVSGVRVEGDERRSPAPDQFRFGHARRFRAADDRRASTMKPWWEITDAEAKACLEATTWHAGSTGYFRGRWSSLFSHPRRHARHDGPDQPGQRPRPGAAIGRRRDGRTSAGR